MNETPVCERAPDLMAFLYREMNEGQTRAFELHLRDCANCCEELASFGVVRESITAWRDEALAGFVSTPLPVRKSALAALRQFFDLSPLWLKAATGFAVVAFCVLVALLISNNKPEVVVIKTDAIYTQADVNRLVAEAVGKQQQQQPVEKPMMVVADPPRRRTQIKQTKKDRRPFSRAEREQLAADLRLLTSDDDLDLTDDRINR